MSFAFIKSLYRASPVAFGSIDILNDQIIYSSGHAESLLGYTPEELKALSKQNFKSIVHPDDLEMSQDAIDRLMKSADGEIVESVFRVRKSDGDYLYLLVRDIVFERDADSNPTKFSTIAQDITHTVELEKELSEKVEALKKISFKNSHEVRAPVANIIALVDLMKPHNFKTQYNQRIFRYLEETVLKLDNIIHDINELSS